MPLVDESQIADVQDIALHADLLTCMKDVPLHLCQQVYTLIQGLIESMSAN